MKEASKQGSISTLEKISITLLLSTLYVFEPSSIPLLLGSLLNIRASESTLGVDKSDEAEL